MADHLLTSAARSDVEDRSDDRLLHEPRRWRRWFGVRLARRVVARLSFRRGQYLWPWFTSFLAHALLLVILAAIVLTTRRRLPENRLIASPGEPLPVSVSLDVARPSIETSRPLTVRAPVEPDATDSLLAEIVPIDWPRSARRAPVPAMIPRPDRLGSLILGGGLEGRGASMRAVLAAETGGSEASEDAVEQGLRWLADHQMTDGSWRFDFRQSSRCQGQCRHHGSIPTTTGATGLALLPFLGAGYTHQEGTYHDVVRKGLYYLLARAEQTGNGADLQEGTMYAQGLATMALSEAYGMTHDESLRELAQAAVDWIVHGQHVGGGWRYFPGQPGDTTVTGWQLMALKSGQLAGLYVPSPVWHAAGRFLDSVQSDGGAQYGYQGTRPRQTTSAVGLLCRMYLGWPHQHPGLRRGVRLLARLEPSDNDMYFNYYATQVLHHYEGAHWRQWNSRMRDGLIATQSHEGHESGSWQFSEPHSIEAGRLYNTAMAIMVLEVYYRYLPLYGREATLLTP